MTMLVTLAEAKKHLRIDELDLDLDGDIVTKIEGASAIVLRHLKISSPLWPDYEPSDDVRMATLLTLSDLFDGKVEMQGAARTILHPLREPTVA